MLYDNAHDNWGFCFILYTFFLAGVIQRNAISSSRKLYISITISLSRVAVIIRRIIDFMKYKVASARVEGNGIRMLHSPYDSIPFLGWKIWDRMIDYSKWLIPSTLLRGGKIHFTFIKYNGYWPNYHLKTIMKINKMSGLDRLDKLVGLVSSEQADGLGGLVKASMLDGPVVLVMSVRQIGPIMPIKPVNCTGCTCQANWLN